MRLSSWGRGPLVVKLAGIAGGVWLYREEMVAAVGAGFRVLALDTTGDRSDDPATAPLGWDSLTDEVVRAVDRHGERAVLWGTSFGSVLATATAARHPDRVSGLLLCHPPDPGCPPPFHRTFFRWLKSRPQPERIAASIFRAAFVALNGWEILAPKTLVRLPELAREARTAQTPGSTVLQKLSLLFEEDPGLPPASAPIPAAIIAGRWDSITTPAAARAIAHRLPGARLHWLSFSGHAGAYSRAATYKRIAIEELRRLTADER
jgi:pimeloyl-ACP methyl ester carboxylesterase